jgi:hypothetical protein
MMEGLVPVTFGTTFAFGFVAALGFGCLVLVVMWLVRRLRAAAQIPSQAGVQSTRRIHLDGKVEKSPTNDAATLASSTHSDEHLLANTQATSTLCSPVESSPSSSNKAKKFMVPTVTRNPMDDEDDDSYHQRLEEHPLQVSMAPAVVFLGGTESAAKEYRRACRSNRQRLEEMVPGDKELGLAPLEAMPPLMSGTNFWWKTRECSPPRAVSVSSESDDDDDDSLDADLQRHMTDMGILVDL